MAAIKTYSYYVPPNVQDPGATTKAQINNWIRAKGPNTPWKNTAGNIRRSLFFSWSGPDADGRAAPSSDEWWILFPYYFEKYPNTDPDYPGYDSWGAHGFSDIFNFHQVGGDQPTGYNVSPILFDGRQLTLHHNTPGSTELGPTTAALPNGKTDWNGPTPPRNTWIYYVIHVVFGRNSQNDPGHTPQVGRVQIWASWAGRIANGPDIDTSIDFPTSGVNSIVRAVKNPGGPLLRNVDCWQGGPYFPGNSVATNALTFAADGSVTGGITNGVIDGTTVNVVAAEPTPLTDLTLTGGAVKAGIKKRKYYGRTTLARYGQTLAAALAENPAQITVDAISVSQHIPGTAGVTGGNVVTQIADADTADFLLPTDLGGGGSQTDTTAPSLVSAIVVGDTLTLSFDENLDESSVPAITALLKGDGTNAGNITVAGAARAVSSVQVTGNTVTATLASAVTSGQACSFSYTPPATGKLRDLANPTPNNVAAISNQAITNNTAGADPTQLPALPGGDVRYGDTSKPAGATAGGLTANRGRGRKISVAQQITVTKLHAYVDSIAAGTQSYRWAIFDTAGTLVWADPSSQTFTGTFTEQWVSRTAATPFTLDAGDYYIGLHTGTTQNVARIYGLTGSIGDGAFYDDTFADGTASSVTLQSGSNRYVTCIEGTPTGGGSPPPQSDTTAPTLLSISHTATGAVDCVYDELLDTLSIPPPAQWAVTLGGSQRTVLTASIVSGRVLRLQVQVQNPLTLDDDLRVSYAVPASNKLRDLATPTPNNAAAFTNVASAFIPDAVGNPRQRTPQVRHEGAHARTATPRSRRSNRGRGGN